MKNGKKKLKVIEWSLLLVILLSLIFYKYMAWGCIILCGDWYDDTT